MTARAFWMTSPGIGEIRTERVPDPGPDEVLVRTLHSGVSRGTETLVFQGRVPESQWPSMRAPFQSGDFPAPVKYGYLNVGVVEAGVPELIGKTVFCLYPHQTRYVVPATAVTVVPDGVPAARAVLTGTVETAVNAVWDAAPQIGDRISVVGGGMVGLSVAAVLAGMPGTDVELVDVQNREKEATKLNVGFAHPEKAAPERDIVIHASATEQGLTTALELLDTEGTVVELSWYGDRRIAVPLGEFFHSRRLTIRSSQVGGIAPARRRSYAQRLALALDLLKDPRFDALISGRSGFDELPAVMPRIADGSLPALCHVIDHPAN
ncbi:threonine dehydrogenase-like Zn-dependent dehydrogenase [Actinoplanes campanulatus]|uniref:Threonine dehydrogenase-like Zn-dependent dehydrogenase n=1 Tax=Actinoplanes campanulatus TaxID=113559 RepID=A0A7W5AJB9_9ACTN|nr:threonine dehydrogenase-like Zn-dependent dehydrogenase [Actinoplanes campanulatus]GGN44331.1 dehydrogenase [Actinoplanes campanulatus]GID37354.1 dehydrogenase [Actinoplanes campanulatus]